MKKSDPNLLVECLFLGVRAGLDKNGRVLPLRYLSIAVWLEFVALLANMCECPLKGQYACDNFSIWLDLWFALMFTFQLSQVSSCALFNFQIHQDIFLLSFEKLAWQIRLVKPGQSRPLRFKPPLWKIHPGLIMIYSILSFKFIFKLRNFHSHNIWCKAQTSIILHTEYVTTPEVFIWVGLTWVF